MIIFLLVGILLMGVAYAYAEGFAFGPGPRGGGLEFRSSLTLDQKAKLQELLRKFEEETASLRGSILTKRFELRALWRNPQADDKALRQKEKELRELQNQLADRIMEHRLEARKLLTPEQLSSLGFGGWMRDPGMGFGKRFRKHYEMVPPHFRGGY